MCPRLPLKDLASSRNNAFMRLTLRYTLVTFNDYGPDIKKNVEVVLDTSDIKVSRRKSDP